MFHFTLRNLFVFVLLITLSGKIAAQTGDGLVVLDVDKSRHVVTAYDQDQTIDLFHLKKGETYSFIVPPDNVLGSCIPDVSLFEPSAELLSVDVARHMITFRAKSSIAQVKLHYPCSWSPDDPPRHYVSISCVGCAIKYNEPSQADMAVLTVENAGAEELIREVFIGGNCFDVTNVTFSGAGEIGKFFNGLTNIGFETGMIMCSGSINVAPGPNNSDSAGGGGSGGGDPDLAGIAVGPLFDEAIVEFDFTPTQTPLTFRYAFASEEYCEYVQSSFNDVFGFFISGPGIPGGIQNLAVLPSTNTPITINTINHVTNPGFYTANTPLGLDNCETGGVCNCLPPQTPANGPASQELQYDGFTKQMIAVANVIPCSTYHIKLGIADVSDGLYDSAVFLKAGSFDGGGAASIDWLVDGQPDIDEVVEGCGTVELLIDRLGTNLSQPLPVSFTVTGTATTGVDYSPIPFTIVIPAGLDQVYFPVNIINDLIDEGAETIVITLNNPCSCLMPEETLTILDYHPLAPLADTITICGPAGVGTVGVTVEGGVEPYTYLWNTGSSDPEVSAFVSSSTNFTVTITDACGKTKTAIARIKVSPTPVAQIIPPGPQLCPGQTAEIPVNLLGKAPFELTVSLNGDPLDPIPNINGNSYTLIVDQPGLYQIFSVIDSFGCPGAGAGAVLVTESTLDLTGVVTNATCSNMNNGSINTTVVGGQGPYNYTWSGPTNISNIPDPVNLIPGDYSVTVLDGFGCTNVQNFIVQSPPPLAPSTAIQNVNCYAPNGGSIDLTVSGGNPSYNYLWSTGDTLQDLSNLGVGTYTVTVTDQMGCSNTNSSTIIGDFTDPTAVANVNDVITCVVSSIPLDGSGSSVDSNIVYQWSANPGNIISGDDTLDPIVDETGSYILVVTNLTNGCNAADTVDVVADNIPPITDAGPDGTLTCVVNDLNLDASGSSSGQNFTYLWTASNGGNIISGDSTLNPLVGSTGTYTLLITNTSNGCTSTDVAVVDDDLAPPVAVVAPGGEITCVNPNLQLSGAGSSTGPNFSYNWTTVSGNISMGGNTLTPTVTAVGTYVLQVTNTTNGCTSTASTMVTSNANVPTSIAAPQGIITCSVLSVLVDGTGSSSGSNYSYQWSTSDGEILGGQGTLQLNAGAPGTYTLLVTDTQNNCTASFSTLVDSDLAPPIANAGAADTLTCVQPSLSLDGSSSSTGPNFTYNWSTISGGNFVSPTNIQNPQVDAPGVYEILVTNTTNGCTSTAQVEIFPDASEPVAQIASPATLNCTVSQIDLNTSGTSIGTDYVYDWSGPGLLTPNDDLNAMVDQPGTYTLLVTNTANGCTSQTTVDVPQDIVSPSADAGPDMILDCNNPQQQIGGSGNPSGSNYSFDWTGPGIVTGANTPGPIVDQAGMYTVVVTNTDNGCTQTDVVDLTEDFVNPQVTAGPGFQLTCVDNTYTMQTTGSTGANFTYQWSTVQGSFVGPTDVLNPTVDGAGNYTILVTNTTNGCTSTALVQITQANDVPTAIANSAPLLTCATTSLTLSGSGSSTGSEFTYQWNATNGGNIVSGAQGLNPLIDEPGTYTLIVFNTLNSCASNSSVVVQQDITPPNIDAGASPTITCTDVTVDLGGSVSSSGTFDYQWQAINNGNITNGSNTLTPTVDAAGTYILTVTSQANGCTSTDQVDVLIDQVPPLTAIQQPDILTCAVPQISIDATQSSTSNMDYSWTTSGGNIVDQSNPLQPVVDAPGTYTLLVTSNINGCTSSQTVTVPQDIVNPVASAGSNGLLTCATTTLQLDGNGSSQGANFSYSWVTSDGQIQSGGTGLSPTVSAGGTYVLTVMDDVNGCTSTDNVLVNVDAQLPNVAIASPGLITCTVPQVTLNGSGSQGGSNISYTWTTGNGTIVGGTNSNSAVVSSAGNYTLTLLNSTNGCSASETVVVTDNIVLPNAEAGPPFMLTCTVTQVSLEGSGSTGTNYTYGWTTSDGQIVSGGNGLQPIVNQNGTYLLTVTNTLTGCTQTDDVEVLVETNIPTDLAVDLVKPTCHDNDGVITFGTVTGGIGPYVYSINGGQTFTPALDFGQITPGTYDLWIQDANGCEYHESLIVPQAPDPNISIDPSFKIILGDSLTLHAVLPPGYPLSLIDTITWTPLDGLTFDNYTIPGLLSPTAKPFKSTEYLVVVTSKDGCEAQDRVLVRVDNEPHIYIPNAFTPDHSNTLNDIFMIFADNKQIQQVDKFQVYDRWGELLFTDSGFMPNDPAHGWDGNYRDKPMTPAVFVYYAEIRLIDGRVLLYKGDVTLVR